MPVDAEWFDRIFQNAGRPREPKSERPRRRRYDRPKPETYKTLCVRLCDGFYFPISRWTRRERFAVDAKRCEQSCPTGSRLFVHRNPGQDVVDMVDLDGRPYRSLPTAFLHRAQYVADCTCRGNPWDEASVARHRAYAEAAKHATRPSSSRTKHGLKEEQSLARREYQLQAVPSFCHAVRNFTGATRLEASASPLRGCVRASRIPAPSI